MSLAILPDYFDKHFDTANIIVHLGMSTGIIVIPLLTQFLLDIYGWRGSLMIIGALYFHLVAFAALARPPKTKPNPCREELRDQVEKDDNKSELGYRDHVPQVKIITAISSSLDLQLFKNFRYVAQITVSFGTGYYYTGWLIYQVPHALDSGFQPHEASAMATVGGIGHIVGNIVYMLQLKVMTNKNIVYSSTIMASLSLLLDPFFTATHSYSGLLMMSFATNVGSAAFNCAGTKYIMDIVEPNSRVNSINWSFACYSVGSILSGCVSGKVSHSNP